MARIALVQVVNYREYSDASDVVGLYEGNLAFSFLSHFLKAQGHEVMVADVNLHEDYIGRIIEFGPELTGLRFEGYESQPFSSVIQELRKYEPNTRMVVGGPGTMLYRNRPRQLLEETSADYVVVGDGIPALHLIAVGQPDSAGVSYTKGGEFITHGVAPYQVEVWQMDPHVLGYEDNTFRVISSLGCAHRCSFCDAHVYTPRILYRPLARVLGDLAELHQHKEARAFSFGDPDFLHRKGHLIDIDRGMESLDLHQRIAFQSRVDTVLACLDEIATSRHRINRLDMGVESFVPEQLVRWNKRTTVAQNISAIEELRSMGILPFLYVILGDLESDEREFRQATDFFCSRPEYLLITQPSGLVQYHDARDQQYSEAALAYQYFFANLWQNVRLAWTDSSLAGFRERSEIPEQNKLHLKQHFENLYSIMRNLDRNCLTEADHTRLRNEAQMTALLLGCMYQSPDDSLYGHLASMNPGPHSQRA